MGKVFKNKVDIESGRIFSIKDDNVEVATAITPYGYHACCIYDNFGNYYGSRHEVIMAEGLQLPKHLWPIDEKGKRFVVDHIIPISNGGTDMFNNLRLIPKSDNSRNPISRKNFSKWERTDKTRKKISEALKGKNNTKLSKTVYQYTLDGELVKVWPSVNECGRNGFSQGKISKCCIGKRKKHKGFRWSYEKKL